jgi:hypothetical protein
MTMQFNLEHNRWWHKTEENKESTPEKNQGRCLAIGKFRDVLGVYQYHQDDHIQKIMKTQIKRIEEAFKTVEDVIIPQGEAYFKDKDGKARPAYKSLGLDKKWKDFMTDVYDARIIKIEEWMDKWAQQFREFLKQDGKITGLGQMFQKRAPAWTDQCGVATDDEIKHRINLLLEAYEDRGKMENPIDW